MSSFRTVLISVGSPVLALTLIGLGLVELINPAMLGAFATWGYPERFHVLLSAVEIAGGLLLLVPGFGWYTLLPLGILLAGALGSHHWDGQAQHLVQQFLNSRRPWDSFTWLHEVVRFACGTW